MSNRKGRAAAIAPSRAKDTAAQKNGRKLSAPAHSVLDIEVMPNLEKASFFLARLLGCERVLCVSREPILESARVLLDEGHSPASVLRMWHSGAEHWALRAQLGKAARLTVEESAHGPTLRGYRPSTGSTVEAARSDRIQHEGDGPLNKPIRPTGRRSTGGSK